MNNNYYNPIYSGMNNYGQQIQPQASQTETFMGIYVNDYNQVINTAIPISGQTVLFADLDNGRLWSKKLVNNMPVIQSFEIKPVYEEVKQPSQKPMTQSEINNAILQQLENMTKEINNLKNPAQTATQVLNQPAQQETLNK